MPDLAAAVGLLALAAGLVAGIVLVVVVRPRLLARRRAAFARLGDALGFATLKGPSPAYFACGGEAHGRRFVLYPVDARSILPPHIAVLSEAALTLDIPGGGVLLRPGRAPTVNGGAAATPALRATLTPSLLTTAASRLRGRFAFRLFDTMVPDAALRVLVRSRWPEDWRGLVVETWVPRDADAIALRAAMAGLASVRDMLATAPGVRER